MLSLPSVVAARTAAYNAHMKKKPIRVPPPAENSDAVKRLLDADGAAKTVLDAAGAVLYANPAAAALFEQAAARMKGAPFPCALPPGGVGEVVLPAATSAEKTLDIRVRALDWHGARARLVSLCDVTAAVELRRLRSRSERFTRDLDVKNRFLGRISHELRNTLSPLATAAYCLKQGLAGPLTPRQARLVEMISRNAQRQRRIIDNVLDLTRFQSGKLRIRYGDLDLRAVIGGVVEECRLAAGFGHFKVEIGALPPVRGDADLVAQVLRNLLDNALRFARRKIVIKAYASAPGAVAVSVSDDGAGIPVKRLGELFGEFVQLEGPPHGDGYKGTGLGLAICKEIVEAHGGRIWAENAKGRGARFVFEFPARERSHADVANALPGGDLSRTPRRL